MTDQPTAQDYVNKRRREEYEEANHPWVKKQRELDFWWEQMLERRARAGRPDVVSEYDPIRRLDAELDYAQAEADRQYVRRHFTR